MNYMGNCNLECWFTFARLHDFGMICISFNLFCIFLDFNFDLAWLHDFGAWWSLPPLPRCALAKWQMTQTQTYAPPLNKTVVFNWISDIKDKHKIGNQPKQRDCFPSHVFGCYQCPCVVGDQFIILSEKKHNFSLRKNGANLVQTKLPD